MGLALLRQLSEAREEASKPHVPPDPTRYDLTWGGEYPCLRAAAVGQVTHQCPGKMIPAKRCFRYEGTLWRRFRCNKCGREATDLKVSRPPLPRSSERAAALPD